MKYFFVTIIVAFSLTVNAQTTAARYIEKYDELAIGIMNELCMPASVVLGIAIHESAAGTSKLCRLHHNHFGVKGRSAKTKNGIAFTYQHFDSDSAAYEHFANHIATRRFYKSLKGDMDYIKWLDAIRKTGYAASPLWMKQVTDIIKKNSLTKFDKRFAPSDGNN